VSGFSASIQAFDADENSFLHVMLSLYPVNERLP
jgi:hypothetical protein